MTTQEISLIAGISLLVVAAIGGNITTKVARIPRFDKTTRALLGILGIGICTPWILSFFPKGNSELPTGTITAFHGKVAPDGWLICDGEPLPNDTRYKDLRNLVGDRLPDLRGVFLRGLDPKSARDPEPRHVGDYQSDSVGSHRHTVSLGGGEHTHNASFTAAVKAANDGDNTSHPGAHSKKFDLTIPGGGHSHSGTTDENALSAETRPKNVAVLYIIKY